MDLQKTDTEYAAFADRVIANAGNPEDTADVVCRLAARLMNTPHP